LTGVPKRLVVLGGGIIGCEFASIFERFGTEVTIVEMLDTLIPQEDADATSELRKSFARRGIVVHLGKQCTKVEDSGAALVVHFGEGETTECDLMLVSVGRAPLVEGVGVEAVGVTFDLRAGIATDAHRRTSVPNIYAAGDVAGYWQLAHTAFREGEIAAENATGHEAPMPDTAVPRPIYTDPEIAGVGLTEAEARERYGDENVSVGRFPWVANARAVMTGEAGGWVKSIHETTYGRPLGVVIVGPPATDLIGAAGTPPDPEAAGETVPPEALPKGPRRIWVAPVKLPFSWPNSSLSISVGATAPQSMGMNGFNRRGLSSTIALATHSFPVPLSPVMSTLASVGATLEIRS